MRRAVKLYGPIVELSRLQGELNRLFAAFVESNKSVAGASTSWDPSVDLVDEFTDRYPMEVLCRVMGVPPADIPRLKNRVWTENLGESGKTLTANGSSNDSSISCNVKELSRLKGGLFQSNSIAA